MIRELEFQLLSQKHRDELYRYARSMLRNPADAEDATQEVLIRLWNHLPTVRLFNLRGWLFRTTRNYCLDQIRRRGTATVSLEDESLEEQQDETVLDPGTAAEADGELERAQLLLRKLPESLRSVFVLYEVNRLRYREIATTLDIPINTVKVRLLRARERLAQLVRKEEPWTTNSRD
jgi:RNA polymerase sigma-70 factor (ECF subfamily)